MAAPARTLRGAHSTPWRRAGRSRSCTGAAIRPAPHHQARVRTSTSTPPTFATARLASARRRALLRSLGTLIAASRAPTRVRSLTLIEPPLFYLVPGDPDVARLEDMGNAVLTRGLDADAATLREFLRLAGAPNVDEGPLPEEVARGVRRAQGGRLPGEARPALDVLREAEVPVLVASGGHAPALDRICDALATELRAERLDRARRWTLRRGGAGLCRSARAIPRFGELRAALRGRPAAKAPRVGPPATRPPGDHFAARSTMTTMSTSSSAAMAMNLPRHTFASSPSPTTG